jgi:hypothetical protein
MGRQSMLLSLRMHRGRGDDAAQTGRRACRSRAQFVARCVQRVASGSRRLRGSPTLQSSHCTAPTRPNAPETAMTTRRFNAPALLAAFAVTFTLLLGVSSMAGQAPAQGALLACASTSSGS